MYKVYYAPTQNATKKNGKMEDKKVRLNKALADAGICSRRKADELIFAGLVTVNGQKADTPALRIDTKNDIVLCQGRKVFFSAQKKTCVLMLHKPVSVVSTVKDPEGRKTVLDFLPPAYKTRRIYPVGRLDFFSEGLLLLTDDGELANRLMHPRWHMPRVYHVKVRLPDKGYDLQKTVNLMEKGMKLAEGEELAPVRVRLLKTPKSEQEKRELWLEFTLSQGINRQIRRMCRDTDLTILTLKRVQQGPLLLGDLPKGEVRGLTAGELRDLRRLVGLTE